MRFRRAPCHTAEPLERRGNRSVEADVRGRWSWLGVALLAACMDAKDSRQNEVTFTCEGGAEITAWFEDGAARVLLPGATEKVRLTQVNAPLGDRYEGAGYRFWVYSDSAALERNGARLYHGCAP